MLFEKKFFLIQRHSIKKHPCPDESSQNHQLFGLDFRCLKLRLFVFKKLLSRFAKKFSNGFVFVYRR
jgi:hypothetical protein